MLVLSRRPGQGLRIGSSVEVQVVRLEGDRVVLGIVAPRHVAVVRSELLAEVTTEVQDAADTRARLRVMLKPRPAGIASVPDSAAAGPMPGAPSSRPEVAPSDDPTVA